MRKILLTVLGSAAMLVAVGQVASAKDNTRHHARHVEQRSTIFTDVNARDSNAQYRVGQQFDGRYNGGGFSAPAGR